MNKKTIKKVLEELAKDKPDLSYMRGLLEGLVEEEELVTKQPYIPAAPTPVWTSTDPRILDAKNPLSSKWNPDPTQQAINEIGILNQ